MDANTDQMPGDAEAAGAIAGMQEIYGRVFAVGDYVCGSSNGWAWAGRIEWIQDDPYELVVNDGRSIIGRNPSHVTH